MQSTLSSSDIFPSLTNAFLFLRILVALVKQEMKPTESGMRSSEAALLAIGYLTQCLKLLKARSSVGQSETGPGSFAAPIPLITPLYLVISVFRFISYDVHLISLSTCKVVSVGHSVLARK